MWCFGILLTYCALTQPGAVQGATFCQVYKPVLWSVNDTRLTKEQVDSMNRTWKRLCKAK